MPPLEPDPGGTALFSPADLEQITTTTFVEQIFYRAEVESTNDVALTFGRDPTHGSGTTMILADRQSAGRGRGTNRWWSGPGALTFSLLLDAGWLSLPKRWWPKISLTAGLAVCEALTPIAGDNRLAVKWPNDVYLNGRKVSGILAEAIHGEQGRIVLGFGINVNNAIERAPPELRQTAIALCDICHVQVNALQVLQAILRQLAEQLNRLRVGDGDLREPWRRRCMLTGKTVQVSDHSQQFEGRCLGIDDDGALVLESESGRHRCLTGTVKSVDDAVG